ncbi:hypothetical protein [Sulfuriflexus mobilis]|uniref:hypothetical protein n=1 Tax=Sulfuriflexus mobilis TaxID=1811807 RepID=UPI000F847D3C|nr:hypothetical protein [Sulfuriflexus mobilis]
MAQQYLVVKVQALRRQALRLAYHFRVVLGAGGAFAGMLIEELKKNSNEPKEESKTTYSVINAEKDDKNT